MDDAPPLEQRLLMQEVSAALRSGTSGADLAGLMIRVGWQTHAVTAASSSVLQGPEA